MISYRSLSRYIIEYTYLSLILLPDAISGKLMFKIFLGGMPTVPLEVACYTSYVSVLCTLNTECTTNTCSSEIFDRKCFDKKVQGKMFLWMRDFLKIILP